MLEGDTPAAALKAVSTMGRDPRVRHFYDPDRRSGAGIARSLGATAGETAWDIYLFYPADGVWDGDEPPPPLDWVHQLGGDAWADRSRYRTGDDLVSALVAIMARLSGGAGKVERRR